MGWNDSSINIQVLLVGGRAYYKEKNAITLQNFNVVVIIFWTYISHICQINASIGVLLLSKKVGLPLIYIQAEKTHEALKYHQYPPNAYGKKREKLKEMTEPEALTVTASPSEGEVLCPTVDLPFHGIVVPFNSYLDL